MKKRNPKIRKKWIAIFNRVYAKEGDKMAFMVANNWLKKQVKTLTARSTVTRDIIKFDIDVSKTLIKRSRDGEEYISQVLATVDENYDGKKFTEDVLKKWEQDINSGNAYVGDIDHEMYDKVAQLPDDQVRDALKSKPSIAKTVKAIYEKGKLWVKLLLDKRYKKLVRKAKGLSLEAFISSNEKQEVYDGELLGFTFCVNETPAMPL